MQEMRKHKNMRKKKKIVDSYKEEELNQLKSLKTYKFYPTYNKNTHFHKNMVPSVNRYYGNCYRMFPIVEPGIECDNSIKGEIAPHAPTLQNQGFMGFSSTPTIPNSTGFNPSFVPSISTGGFQFSFGSNSNTPNNIMSGGNGGFFNPLATNTKVESVVADGWKCLCCETINSISSKSCKECFVNKPANI